LINDGKFHEGKEATAGLGGRWAGGFFMHRHTPYYLIMKWRVLTGVRWEVESEYTREGEDVHKDKWGGRKWRAE